MDRKNSHLLLSPTCEEDRRRKFYRANEFSQNDKLLMIPGPTNLHPNVLNALSKPILSHTDDLFYQLLYQIQDGIRSLFKTENLYTFALTGSATIAMEASICNILKPGQKLLSLIHGYWGHRVVDMGKRLGCSIETIIAPIGGNFTLSQIENALHNYRPNLMYVCHGDSSLGTVQNLDGIGSLCHKYDCLLIVDAVVSLCTTPLAMDQMEIDVLFSGGQKGLSGPPGVSLISFSDRAMKTIRKKDKLCPSFYMDIELIAEAWGVKKKGFHKYHYTPAVNLLYGLRASIVEVIDEGLSNVIDRHQKMKLYMAKRLEEIGLEQLVKNPNNRLAGITSVLVPKDIDSKKVIQFMYQKYDILIGGSLFGSCHNMPNFWRIGYLGVNSDQTKIDLVIEALGQALKNQRNLKAHL